MTNYQEIINSVCLKINQKELKYTDTIVIGDNSVGKSELLKILIESYENKQGEIYYLDAVNRKFSAENINFIPKNKEIKYNQAIIETRLEEKFFNLVDSFNLYGTGVEGIEEIYFAYEKPLQAMMKDFLGIGITAEKNIEKYILIDGKRRKLSSGFQAILRIFLELLYYQDTIVKNNQFSRYLFIIDEVDEYLAPKNSFNILKFVKEKFPDIDFIVTTHSEDVIAGARNFNVIALADNNYEVLDSNDFDSMIEINALFNKLFKFSKPMDRKSEIDNELRRLLNNRVSGELDSNDSKSLDLLKKETLTKAQMVLMRQIEEW